MTSRDDLFWAKVSGRDPMECWIWTAAKNNMGYGVFRVRPKNVYAHRYAYEALIGPIGDGLVLDHLCRNQLCVNPAHLEAVSQSQNVSRGLSGIQWRERTHCAQGHPYDESNTRWRGTHRHCIACQREWGRQYLQRQRGRAA